MDFSQSAPETAFDWLMSAWTQRPPMSSPPVMSATTVESSVQKCIDAVDLRLIFDYIQIGVSAIIVAALSFAIRRMRVDSSCCDRRPGILYPVNLIDDTSRRWPFVLCYVVVTADIVSLYTLSTYFKDQSKWAFSWSRLLAIVVACVFYYPLFACLTHRRHVAANVIGFLYASTIFLAMVWLLKSCIKTASGITQKDSFLYSLVYELPFLVASAILVLVYLYDFGQNIYRCKPVQVKGANYRYIDNSCDTNADNCGHFDYVSALFKSRSACHQQAAPPTLKKRFKNAVESFTSGSVAGFRYPSRLVCTLAVCSLLVCVMVVTAQYMINNAFQSLNSYEVMLVIRQTTPSLDEILTVIQVTLCVANAISGALNLAVIIRMLLTYKQHLLRYLKGSYKLHKKLTSSPVNILVNSMSYPGYQVTAFFYGFWYTLIVFFVFGMLIAYLIVMPIKDNRRTALLNSFIDHVMPAAIVSIGICTVRRLACRFLFLQDGGRVLALRNRRLLHVLTYFLSVFNFVVGFFSCAKRLLIAMFSGTVLLSRLDVAFFVHGIEKKDSCHVAYLSMVVLDVCQNHPVMRTFVDLLQQTRDRHANSQKITEAELRKRRVRNRWLKLRTLINNPSLVLERLQRLHDSHEPLHATTSPCAAVQNGDTPCNVLSIR